MEICVLVALRWYRGNRSHKAGRNNFQGPAAPDVVVCASGRGYEIKTRDAAEWDYKQSSTVV